MLRHDLWLQPICLCAALALGGACASDDLASMSDTEADASEGETAGDGDGDTTGDGDGDGDTTGDGDGDGDTTGDGDGDTGCEMCGGEACVDLQTDPQHCGACDNACPADVPCVAGSCSCPEGKELCDGACVDTSSNPSHCGGCGAACAPDQVCAEGSCTAGCGELSDCGGACVDLQTNPDHCGECGNACGLGGACEMGSCGCPGDGVSFVDEVEPMLADACTGLGCHSGPAPASGLDLSPGQVHANLVGVPSTQCADRMLVEPGQPGASYLMDKVLGVNLCFGTKMPKAAPDLTDAEIATLSEWICRGALAD